MDAFTYVESDGCKGGNNVVSLLWKYIVENDIRLNGTRKKLTFTCDNCTGQNKNKIIFKFCLYLVEMEIYKEVEIIYKMETW